MADLGQPVKKTSSPKIMHKKAEDLNIFKFSTPIKVLNYLALVAALAITALIAVI